MRISRRAQQLNMLDNIRQHLPTLVKKMKAELKRLPEMNEVVKRVIELTRINYNSAQEIVLDFFKRLHRDPTLARRKISKRDVVAATAYEFDFDGETLHLDMSNRYGNGRTAIQVLDQDGAPYATLSVNMDVPLQDGEFCIKNYSENQAIAEAVLATGWFVDTGKRVKSGFVNIPIWKLNK